MEANINDDKKDEMVIVPLGSGCEVGRSCILMKFKGKTIMFDCGIHQGKKGYDSLPFFDSCKPEEIDLILITHFHTDHCAALPYFLKNTDFLKGNGKIYMTSPTKAIYRPFTQDSLKVKSENISLYKKEDVDKTMRHIEIINFNQEFEYNGITFKCYCAGHVLGAAMFQVEVDGVKVLYTGDYSTEIERLMQPAEIPGEQIDVLVVESTFGKMKHMPRKEREQRLKDLIFDCVRPKTEEGRKQGKVLLPVTTSGRAEELLLILDELWEERPEIQDVPIQFKSKKFDKFKEIFQIYLDLTPKEIRNKTINPFDYKHVTVTKEGTGFEKNQNQRDKPCVVLASPGQMNEGSYSREIFHDWCQDPDNLCILTGFSQEGSFARNLQKESNPRLKIKNEYIQSKIRIETLSFCAHADFEQTREFVSEIEPEYIVLVHGQEKRAKELQRELSKQFKDKIKRVVAPKNQEQELFYFSKKQNCKIVGNLYEKVSDQIDQFKEHVKQYQKPQNNINQESEEDEDKENIEQDIENLDDDNLEQLAQQIDGDGEDIKEEEDDRKKQDELQQKQDDDDDDDADVEDGQNEDKMDIEQQNENEQSIIEEEELEEEQKENLEVDNQKQDEQKNNIDINKKEKVIQQKIKIEGLLYQNEDKQTFLMDYNDKSVNIPVQRVQLREKLQMNYKGDFELLLFFTQQIVNPQCQIQKKKNNQDKEVIKVREGFQIVKASEEMVELDWISGVKNDELVENFSMLIVQLSNQQANLNNAKQNTNNSNHIFKVLQQEYPLSRIDVQEGLIRVSSETQPDIATINIKTHEIHTNDLVVEKQLKGILSLVEEYQQQQ